ncbi:hypothetical protein ACHAW6_012426 [Cyclotella cf. meneghiniana]
MHFGKTLKERLHQPWAQYYLDYSRLKDILEQDTVNLTLSVDRLATSCSDDSDALASQSTNASVRHLRLSARTTTLAFQAELDYQVRKVVLFFLQQQGSIANRVSLLVDSDELLDETDEDLQSICGDVFHLIEFIELNLTATRKILKKHDRVLRGRRELTVRYFFRPSNDHAQLSPLLEYAGLDAILQTLKELIQWKMRYGQDENHMGTSSIDSILLARDKLQTTSDFVNILASQMLMEEVSEEGKIYERRRISNWLNFISTFLHLTDYYVVAPGCGSYAKLMGGDESLAGLIIGMNSVAALISTLIYSWWTSWSYRGPLICASLCQITGDIIYALALPLGGSLKLVMLGRLLSGFGSARALNRRYIADTFSPHQRTAASATFVTAGALGTSAGPALAAGLYMIVPDEPKSLFWRVENAPCWVMAIVWFVYLMLIIAYFEEPEHPVDSKSTTVNTNKAKVQQEGEANESSNLLPNHAEISCVSSSTKVRPLWENVPVMLTFIIYFVLKFILESLLSSTSVLTSYYFGWNDGQSGSYLAVLGFLVLPANWIVAQISPRYDDRELIFATEICMLIGCLAILKYSTIYATWQYIFASIMIFIGVNALEGPTMSLLSKSIPLHYRRGFWNVGLLATESGTLGRAVGDVILTICGSGGIQYILNNAFGAMSMFSMATIMATCRYYSQLAPSEKDE